MASGQTWSVGEDVVMAATAIRLDKQLHMATGFTEEAECFAEPHVSRSRMISTLCRVEDRISSQAALLPESTLNLRFEEAA